MRRLHGEQHAEEAVADGGALVLSQWKGEGGAVVLARRRGPLQLLPQLRGRIFDVLLRTAQDGEGEGRSFRFQAEKLQAKVKEVKLIARGKEKKSVN